MIGRPYIPETITVHLGAPDSSAANVTVSFPDYIKNVASSEIYPTWPESALRANIYAQISYALNRIYTEWYRSRGYDFDITNSTAYDQSFVQGRDIFENISRIVDEIFNDYIRRQGNVEPLFAAFCDGREVQCDGLSQWGSVELAQQGLVPYEILTNYYGDDIEIVDDAPIQNIPESYPGTPLRLGSSGGDVRTIQVQLNRISTDYPLIPKISVTNGVFGTETDDAVRAFQKTFNLTQEGIVGKATWYKIKYIYVAVTNLAELNSEGISISELSQQFVSDIRPGNVGDPVRVVQYYLSYIALFNNNIPRLTQDGIYGTATEDAVRAFQRAYALPITGIVNRETWNKMSEVYLGILGDNLPQYITEENIPYPGTPLIEGSQGEAVSVLQERLSYISESFTNIPNVNVTGYFGEETIAAVNAFLEDVGLPPKGIVGPVAWAKIEETYLSLLNGNAKNPGQYPGYVLKGEQ